MTNILEARARLGEGACWHRREQVLYWVDIYNHRVHRYDPATATDRHFTVDDVVGCLAPTHADRLIIAQRSQIAFLDTADGTLTPIHQITHRLPAMRFNDGKCDSAGRFWVGSMCAEAPVAALYRYDPDGSLHTIETGLSTSNGLGWSPDDRTFYLTDTPLHRIYAFDFDRSTGAIDNRRIHIDLTAAGLLPDGLTIDREGCLWSAIWDGWCVIRFDPQGKEILRIPMPVQRPTSCAFGGSNLTTLYITSASVGLSETEIQDSFYAGDLFCLPTDVTGMPAYEFAG